MSKYKILVEGEYEDEVFDTEEAAEEHALYLASCAQEGAEILRLSNPGDFDGIVYDHYEIVEIDDN